MFGFIKKLISGILAFIGGLFGGKKAEAQLAGAGAPAKKSSGYFLELDEEKSSSKTQAIAKPAEAAPAKTEATPAKAEATPTPAQPAKVEAVKAAPAKAEAVKAVPQSTNGAKPATSAPAANPAPAATAAFASTASVPNTFGNRRRPGANMDYFLDMARQVKVPS